MRRVWFAALAVTGCTEAAEITFELTPNPIAVGANVDGVLENRVCDSDGIRCDSAPVAIESFTLEPPGIFEAPADPRARFTLRALAGGSATLRIAASSDGTEKSFTQGLVALEPNGAEVMPPCSPPLVYMIGTTAKIPYEIRHDATALHGSDYVPFAATGVTLDVDASTPGLLAVRMPPAPATGELTTPLQPGYSLSFGVIEPATIDAIAFRSLDSAPDAFRRVTVAVDVFAGDQLVCGDQLTRSFATSTPETCTFDREGAAVVTFNEVNLHEVVVRGRAAGLCTFSVTLGGTGLTATGAITFAM